MRVILVILLISEMASSAQDRGSPAGLMADWFRTQSVPLQKLRMSVYLSDDDARRSDLEFERNSITAKHSPGMNRSTTFSEETLRSLYVIAINPSRSRSRGIFGQSESRCPLNERGAKCVAKHLNLTKGVTQVVISGYMDASFSPYVRGLASVYLKHGHNVILVEIFPVLVRTYPMAARTTKPFGYILGEFFAALTQQGLSSNRLEITGGSLGAHIAHFSIVKYKQLTGGMKPARITALDPAGPCFRNVPYGERLNPDAAVSVDVVHTNIDGFGIADTLGHVDFYVNGGEFQISLFSNFILPCFQLCSHVRSAIYLMISFKHPDQFIAVQCDSVTDARHGDCYNKQLTTNLLGPKTNFSRPGIYYLPTSESLPYFMGSDGLKQRKYGHNSYLLKPAPDVDMVI